MTRRSKRELERAVDELADKRRSDLRDDRELTETEQYAIRMACSWRRRSRLRFDDWRAALAEILETVEDETGDDVSQLSKSDVDAAADSLGIEYPQNRGVGR